MGEDGHTASLFPARDWPQQDVFAVFDAPKPPPERVTLGVAALQNCRTMLVLVTGGGKVGAVARWRDGADLPIARVCDVAHARVLVERKCLTFADNQSDTGAQTIESVQ
jgi:6-phosphogluconolactonase